MKIYFVCRLLIAAILTYSCKPVVLYEVSVKNTDIIPAYEFSPPVASKIFQQASEKEHTHANVFKLTTEVENDTAIREDLSALSPNPKTVTRKEGHCKKMWKHTMDFRFTLKTLLKKLKTSL